MQNKIPKSSVVGIHFRSHFSSSTPTNTRTVPYIYRNKGQIFFLYNFRVLCKLTIIVVFKIHSDEVFREECLSIQPSSVALVRL